VEANRQNIAISPDGTQIAFAMNSGCICAWTPSLSRDSWTVPASRSPDLSPDGRSLAHWSATTTRSSACCSRAVLPPSSRRRRGPGGDQLERNRDCVALPGEGFSRVAEWSKVARSSRS
jgi:hypothetical protein